ncbi:hypothetical protein ABPG74_006624 [Tetrahymena malaccensis]
MQHNQQPNIFEQPNYFYQDKIFVKLPNLEVLRAELRYASQYLSAHKLYHSAKWASELLLGVTKQSEIQDSVLLNNFILSNIDNNYKFTKVYQEPSDETFEALLVARNLFDLREFKKCAHILKDYAQNPKYQQCIFLYYYALYMAGEIRKEEEMFEEEQSSKRVVNPELSLIYRDLDQMYKKGDLCDVNRYLYGLVLKDQERTEEARQVFLGVLNDFPCFWSAWIELCKLIQTEDIKFLDFKEHWMKNFFYSSFCLEKHKSNICIEINYGLLCFFKNSNYLINQIAHYFYNSQDFDISLEWFEKLVEIDPFRYENMDTYSNILYIKENQGELANLALRCFYNNKYATETCCVVGNYYSLMGEHLKAVNYFRKALRLDRNCLAAWTLMGHEYLEMKNIPGAIEAYRNAVEIDPKDFRAWYGLGQTYELQSMNHYALYYFTRAVMSRPKDSRMWNAMGNCYEKLNKKNEATRCYERAENGKDKEGIALFQMGKLYYLEGFEERAIQCFEENLKRKDEEETVDKELGECLLMLANHHKKKLNFEKAHFYARRLLDINGAERDEANQIIHEINQMMNQQQVYQQKQTQQIQQQQMYQQAGGFLPKYGQQASGLKGFSVGSSVQQTIPGQPQIPNLILQQQHLTPQQQQQQQLLQQSSSASSASSSQQQNKYIPNITGFNLSEF